MKINKRTLAEKQDNIDSANINIDISIQRSSINNKK